MKTIFKGVQKFGNFTDKILFATIFFFSSKKLLPKWKSRIQTGSYKYWREAWSVLYRCTDRLSAPYWHSKVPVLHGIDLK